ncbi:MAG: methyltransferase domain-containing protein [Candidatus Omnitrophica bacterium]|nr:methyltransferase domain-containing protein [Candidatus Omnitrophota bacterium]
MFKKIEIDNRDYKVNIIRKKSIDSPDACRIIIPTYMPNKIAQEITRMCILSILKYTPEPYELWVVDNNSPSRHTKWLRDFPSVNVAFNKTEPVNPFLTQKVSAFRFFNKQGAQLRNGAYANAIGLEIGIRCIDPDSKYIFVMHSDTLILKSNWLRFFKSQLNDKVRIAAFRNDRQRVQALHIGGMLIDFSIYKKLNMSFLPNIRQERYPHMPEYDVGDQITLDVLKHNYQTFVCRNTFNNPELIENIPAAHPLKFLLLDRCFDNEGDIVYIHMGRGIPKSSNRYHAKGKTYPEEWIEFAHTYVLMKKKYLCGISTGNDLAYSMRRYYIDRFFMRHIAVFPHGSSVLDIGGKKHHKRGVFNIDTYGLKVAYVNIDKKTMPDYCCDAACIPIEDATYDGVICSEVLEHVIEPRTVLREAYRVLKPDGIFLLCVPFMFHVHADPCDYGRYTDLYYRTVLDAIGFKNIEIEKQGLFFSVLANMLKAWIYELSKEGRPKGRMVRKCLHTFIVWFEKKAVQWDHDKKRQENKIFSGYTTGFGIVCKK